MLESVDETAVNAPFMDQAERALRSLKEHVTAHVDREARLCRVYGQWQETWLNRADELRQQFMELEVRLSPWISRLDGPRLGVVSQRDDRN